MSVSGGSARNAERAWSAVQDEMARAEQELSRFRPESALSLANRLAGSGTWFAAPWRLRIMLATCHRAMALTDGRFDPRVIHALEAIGESAGVPLPSPSAEGPWLQRDGCSERLRLGSPVDSGGIGKGLGLRWALAAARSAAPSATGLLVDAGGDIAVSGLPAEGASWSVGIEDPRRPQDLLATVGLVDAAIATSSTAHRTWTHGGRRVHHLLDPRSGLPADTGLIAVTVAMPDPAWAEVWTKALFLAGRAGIGPEARARGFAVWWVEADGSLHMTPAARQLTTWTRAESSAA